MELKMNLNTIKTLLLGSGFLTLVGPWVLNLLMKLFGCVGDDPLTPAVEVAMCTGGDLFTIPVGLQAIIGGIVITGALALTAFFKSGTIKQNLFNRSVPMISSGERNVVGVVTASDVNSL